MSEYKLERLEAVVTSLKEDMGDIKKVLIELTRIEVKHDSMAQRLDSIDRRMNKHSEVIDSMQVKLAEYVNKTGNNEWFIRILIAALVGGVAFIMRG